MLHREPTVAYGTKGKLGEKESECGRNMRDTATPLKPIKGAIRGRRTPTDATHMPRKYLAEAMVRRNHEMKSLKLQSGCQ